MVSRRRFDNRPIGRHPASQQPKRRILIVCEGKETEPEYFKAFRIAERNPRVHVDVVRAAGVPRTVVERAIELREAAEAEAKRQRDQNLRWNEVWGVVDVDEHPNLDQARIMARDNSIELAISNPCFELWALLHFQEQHAHIERHKARAALQQHLPGYDKAIDFPKVHPGYTDAIRRARGLDGEAARHGEPGRNPTTGVYRLTEAIREG